MPRSRTRPVGPAVREMSPARRVTVLPGVVVVVVPPVVPCSPSQPARTG
ncbi:MAG: hypothetical protein R3F14_10420 [Polyangiaceae bacterium]